MAEREAWLKQQYFVVLTQGRALTANCQNVHVIQTSLSPNHSEGYIHSCTPVKPLRVLVDWIGMKQPKY